MKKAKKKGPAPKGRRSAAPTKKKKKVLKKGVVGYRMVAKKPFRLEVGKTYRPRGGHFTATITCQAGGEWPFKGVVDYDCGIKGCDRSWRADGTFWIGEDDGDLIREVPPPKSPKGRGK